VTAAIRNAASPRDFAPHEGNTRTFASPKAWAAWLAKNHAASPGVWIRLFRKDSKVRSITRDEALDEALCWGWIDGQARSVDDQSWLQRFTPRRPRSGWSKRNREHVARLEREGRMQASGKAEVEAARKDGRWQQAYDPPTTSEVPLDLRQAIAADENALAFFNRLNRANLYAISYRLQTAKTPATRQRRFDKIVQMMKDGKTFH
jgi:uncharacterized protein YdeI (YjbR/CyaY-like superfamily)